MQIGHNNPPGPVDMIREELASATFSLANRAAALRASLEKAPQTVTSEDEARPVILLAAQINALLATAGEDRKGRAAEVLKHAEAINGHYTDMLEGLPEGKARLLAILGDYQTATAASGEDRRSIRTDEGPLLTSVFRDVLRIEDEAAIPAEFRTSAINRAALTAALKAGREVPGARIVTERTAAIK